MIILFNLSDRHLNFNFIKTECLWNDSAWLCKVNIFGLSTSTVELNLFTLTKLLGLQCLMYTKAHLGHKLCPFLLDGRNHQLLRLKCTSSWGKRALNPTLLLLSGDYLHLYLLFVRLIGVLKIRRLRLVSRSIQTLFAPLVLINTILDFIV